MPSPFAGAAPQPQGGQPIKDREAHETLLQTAAKLLARILPEQLADVYRRRGESDSCHWCANCPAWPDEAYESTADPAEGDDLCGHCHDLEQRGECKM